MPVSMAVSRKTLSPQCSCTSAEPGWRAARMSRTAGSSSRSRVTLAATSSASARVGATHMATSSPTCLTLPIASGGCSETLKPGNPDTARIALTPSRSAAVNTRSRTASGMSRPRMRACASGLRTKATSCMSGRRMSPTYWPRPRIRRSSSLRGSRAPTPCGVSGASASVNARHPRSGVQPRGRAGRPGGAARRGW